MNVTPTRIPDVLLIEPKVFGDERGFLYECFSAEKYAAAGVVGPFVQDNISRSVHGVLRGLHLQQPHAQGKLVTVLEGEVFDVSADVRPNSPTWGHWVGERLSAANKRQLYIPPGLAHGFCVMSEHAVVHYKCTAYYDSSGEVAIAWNDPDLAISWPVDLPTLSDKDRRARRLKDIAVAELRGEITPS